MARTLAAAHILPQDLLPLVALDLVAAVPAQAQLHLQTTDVPRLCSDLASVVQADAAQYHRGSLAVTLRISHSL